MAALSACCVLLAVVGEPLPPRRPPATVPSAPSHADPVSIDLSGYRWPLNSAHIVTSTFGEYRSTHFHAGIDISTHDRIGMEVLAARDGYVSRILVSPTGYGRLLAIRHPDGCTTVYAHLARFADPYAQRASAEQERLGRFPVDIRCPPGEFPVRRGDVIAYSGESGAVSPHLHFELRDSHMNPVNPLLSPALGIVDGIRPVIRKIALTPIGEGSLVDGSWRPHVIRVIANGGGRFTIRETLRITGEAGLAMDARDRSDGTWFNHGVFGNSLYIDDSLWYAVRLTTVPGDEDQQVGLYYDWTLAQKGLGKFQRLYLEPSGKLAFSRPLADGAGIIGTASLAAGPHTFRIVCTDCNGNSAELSGRLVVDRRPQISAMRDGDRLRLALPDSSSVEKVLLASRRFGAGSWRTRVLPVRFLAGTHTMDVPLRGLKDDIVRVAAEDRWGTVSPMQFLFMRKFTAGPSAVHIEHEVLPGFIRLRISTNGVFTAPPEVVITEGPTKQTVTTEQLEPGLCTAAFRPLASFAGLRRIDANAEVNGHDVSGRDEFTLCPLVPGQPGKLVLDDGNCILAYDSAAVFGTVFMLAEERSAGDTPDWQLLPERTVLEDGLTIALRASSRNPREALFFRSRGSWTLIGTRETADDDLLVGTLHRTLGDVALLTDTAPPRIERLNISQRSSRRPLISFHFADGLSGIEYNELKMYLDGRAVIPEIDGVRHRAVYAAENPLERGPHRLSIQLQDKLGNTGTAERRFVVR